VSEQAEEPPPPLLPDEVRRDLLRLAAQVLGSMPEADVPHSLRRIRAFAPARRADAGAGALAVALEREPVFRQSVAAAWRAANPELAQALTAGELPTAADPVQCLIGLHLLRGPAWVVASRSLQGELERRRAAAQAASAAGDAEATARAASQDRERIVAEREAAREQAGALAEEVAGLRRESRRLRSDADRARAQARAAQRQVADALARASEAEESQDEVVRRLEARLAQAEAEVLALRQGEREARALGDVRVRLLLDTILDAAGGLRRELALPPATASPADFVVPTFSGAHMGESIPSRAKEADDPTLLDELLALPRCHLVVDGYNVTKSGYGDLPLIDQRRRLVDGLAGLVARTHAETTCCFDGAEIDSAPPASRVRGVRVVFSDPGTTADDLVRRLVRAEPAGRPVVVVSSDGEVAAGVRAAGARCVPATALLRLLARS
jgi:predicted RNA-binding protein with PIN domain